MGWLLEAIFPPKCVGCGKLGDYVCQACQVGLWEEEQICPVCCRNSRYGLRHPYCHQSFSLDGLTCFWAYAGVARKLLTKAKYRFFWDYLRQLVEASVRLGLSGRPEFAQLWSFITRHRPVVVAVPLHPKKYRWRGFNQAEMVSRLVARCWSLAGQDLLVRVKETGQQVGKSREERLASVQGAFRLKTSDQLPKAVLLVDDVWTTGATLSECCRILKQAGARRVWGLVLAR